MASKKNRDREAYSFANINMLGKCNVDCFFCLGKDIGDVLSRQNQMKTHFAEWKNLETFFARCRAEGIENLYLTGQNTDPLLYPWLTALIDYIQGNGFKCGIRTNGYMALTKMEVINRCTEEIGYSIHSLWPITNKMILGRSDIPKWEEIIPATKNVRISVVINRCNRWEFWSILRFLKQFENVRYVQVRKVSTDTRESALFPDMKAFEEVYTEVRHVFPMKERLWEDAEVYNIYGLDVVFWRTVQTTVNSLNYFTDGTISDLYFVIEGYMKYSGCETE